MVVSPLTNTAGAVNDLQAFDPHAAKWSRMAPGLVSGALPTAAQATMAAVGASIYLLLDRPSPQAEGEFLPASLP
jgi:hypothetical protein